MKLYMSCGSEAAPEGFEKGELFLPDKDMLDEVIGFHILDKLPIDNFFKILHKTLKEGAKATFHQIYYRHPLAWVHPWTLRCFSEHSLSFLSKTWRDTNNWKDPAIDFDFDVQYGVSMDQNLENRSEDARLFALANYAGAITNIQYIITKK